MQRSVDKITDNGKNTNFALLAQKIAAKGLYLLQAQKVVLFLFEPLRKRYFICCAITREGKPFSPDKSVFDFSAAKECIRFRKWVQSDKVTIKGIQPCLWIPLCVGKDCIGLFYFIDSPPLPFEKSLADRIAIFSERAAEALRNGKFCTSDDNCGEKGAEHASAEIADQWRIKGMAAAKIGHEINNFLSAVNANLELALDLLYSNTDADKIQERIRKAQQLLMRIAPLSHGLMCNCALTPVFEVMNINTVVEDFLEFIKPLYKHTSAQFFSMLHPEMPPVKLDPRLLSQTLFNLCKNAVEAKADAKIFISTQYNAREHCVVLIIEDNGPGLSAEKITRLFKEPFTDKAEGHGLGLAICREIVEKHGGSIEAKNGTAGGACFIIRLPLQHSMEYGELEFDRIERLHQSIDFMDPAERRRTLLRLPQEQVN